MSRREKYREYEVWISGQKTAEFHAGMTPHPHGGKVIPWQLIEWRDDTSEWVLLSADTAEELIRKARVFLSSTEQTGLLLTLMNLGHLK